MIKKFIMCGHNILAILMALCNNHKKLMGGNTMSYQMDYEKAIEAIVWLADNDPGIDIYHVAKILYYAEKMHLNKYGRPIIGATYIRMDFGQVPSEVRDLITQNAWMIEPDYLQRFSAAIKISKEPHDKLTSLRKADVNYFSNTDIECLEECLKKYGKLTFSQLKNLSHKEKTWLETEKDKKIDYLLMIDEDNENQEETLDDIRSFSQYVRF